MSDLFDWEPPESYPYSPGAKGPDGTSQDAAQAISASVTRLRLTALRTLNELGPATPLECCAAANLPRETLQPRFSELRRLGLVDATGDRRRNPSGHSAAVLTLTDRGRAAL